MEDSHTAILAGLVRLGLLGPHETPPLEPLAGGVSSDIFRVDLTTGPACVKRALSKLKVAADWRAPVERNAYEYAWMRIVSEIVPEAVPALLGEDAETGLFVMAFLPPEDYPLWKTRLRDGIAETDTARAVAEKLVRIHGATAGRRDVADQFATDHIFHSIRLEPYLLATARAHPDRADASTRLASVTAATKKALVHGDVSPKNIVLGSNGPVFLDAECAWYGDPAFDLAFCLNHFLLKCLWTPDAAESFLDCFDVLAVSYLRNVGWEPREEFEARAAALLPGLFLARVDGKSPVEYVTDDADRDRVRRVARRLLIERPARLSNVREQWAEEIGA